MPTYEYGCDACGAEWELEQRISEDPVKKCPKCGKRKAKRLISGGNFILKGGGWESDLYHKPKSGGVKKIDDPGKSVPNEVKDIVEKAQNTIKKNNEKAEAAKSKAAKPKD